MSYTMSELTIELSSKWTKPSFLVSIPFLFWFDAPAFYASIIFFLFTESHSLTSSHSSSLDLMSEWF